MTIDRIKDQMQEMGIGMTTIISNQVVTRWTKETWEVGTFNRDRMNIEVAAGKVVFDAISEMI